jgi:23S rRNA-/tRNA-specific pseudouridylate synthase
MVLPDYGTVDYAIDGRPARSTYQVLDMLGTLAARIRMETFQGRTHQVRIHCARGLQAPIVLDRRYGGQEIMNRVKSPSFQKHHAQSQFCLHASTLSIPEFGVTVQAPVPNWWHNVMRELEMS